MPSSNCRVGQYRVSPRTGKGRVLATVRPRRARFRPLPREAWRALAVAVEMVGHAVRMPDGSRIPNRPHVTIDVPNSSRVGAQVN